MKAASVAVALAAFTFPSMAGAREDGKTDTRPIAAAARALLMPFGDVRWPITVDSDDQATVSGFLGIDALARRAIDDRCIFGLVNSNEADHTIFSQIDFNRLTGEWTYEKNWSTGFYTLSFLGDREAASFCYTDKRPWEPEPKYQCFLDFRVGGLTYGAMQTFRKAVEYVMETDCPPKQRPF